MSHSTEVTFHAGLSTYTTVTGSRWLAEALSIKVQEEKVFINQEAYEMALSHIMSEHLCLMDELVIKTMVQGCISDLNEQLDEIRNKREDAGHLCPPAQDWIIDNADKLEKELQNFPVFKLQIKHCD